MENLRWILIIAGIAILAILYFSGRSSRASASNRRAGSSINDQLDPLLGEDTLTDPVSGFEDIHPDDLERADPDFGGSHSTSNMNLSPSDHGFNDDLGRTRGSSPGFTSFAQKIESISARLSPKRRQRIAESEPADMSEASASDPAMTTKIVTLHVVAPQNNLIDGQQLLDAFDRRGYHYGDMNIFHSMHNDITVFSIAKMVEPGFFDIDDIESFATPGITLILQLPGPVPADVSFEVLISEAFELANELNANVLDGDRNTLSKQTLQHMREGIYEYMHRQKYFGSVPS